MAAGNETKRVTGSAIAELGNCHLMGEFKSRRVRKAKKDGDCTLAYEQVSWAVLYYFLSTDVGYHAAGVIQLSAWVFLRSP